MEEIAGVILGIFLCLLLLGGALQSIPYWVPGVGLHFLSALGLSRTLGGRIRQPEVLSRIIRGRWNPTEASPHWTVDSRALRAETRAIPLAALSLVPGVVVQYFQLPFLFALQLPDGLHEFFTKAAGCGMAIAGAVAAFNVGREWMTKASKGAVDAALADFASRQTEAESLYETEIAIRQVAEELGLKWPPGLSEDFQAHLSREPQSLLLDGEVFRQRIASATEAARSDLELISSARDVHTGTLMEYRVAAREANRAGAPTLIEELNSMHHAITSEELMTLVLNRRWDEFADVHSTMRLDLERIARQAKEFVPGQEGSASTAPEEPSLQRALRVLGLAAECSPETMKKRYRELALEYHPDKAAQTTASIQHLASERLKEINAAWQIVRQEMGIT